ncbi:MAG: tandem-95 repeat protein, partial [Chloroflexi bacterium]|nr:tandem-95 repeat protein [Chloroflexota bacterium]
AALALQRFPAMTPAELATYLKTNAADRGADGVDNTWGHGFAGLTAPTAPSAVADAYTIDEDAVLTVSAPSGLLSNDSDDADVFTSSLVTNASNGSVSLDPDGSFTYTPDADYNGSDSFTYKDIDPWQTSSTVSVGLTVNPLADVSGTSSTQGAPNPNNVGVDVVGTGIFSGTANISAGSNGAFTKQLAADTYAFTASADGYIARTKTSQSVTTVDMSIGSTQLRAGDADGDGDVDSADADVLLAAFVAGLPIAANRDDGLGNTVDLNADNLVDAIDISMWASNYGLQGPMAWDTVFTTPPLAIADSFWVFQDTQLSISANGVLGNDFDHEGDSLTATLVDEPSNGNLTLNSDGSFTYDPDSEYVGLDSFTYFASDAQTISVKTTVTIDVLITAPSTPTPTPGGTTGGTTVGTTVGATPTPTAVATPAATATATATVAAGTTGGAVPTATPTPTP